MDKDAKADCPDKQLRRRNLIQKSMDSSSLDEDEEEDGHNQNTNIHNAVDGNGNDQQSLFKDILDEITLDNYYNGGKVNSSARDPLLQVMKVEDDSPKHSILPRNSWFHQEFSQFDKAEGEAREVRPLSAVEAWERAKEAKYVPTAEEMNRSLPEQEEPRTKLFSRVRPSYNIGEILQNYDFEDQRTHELFGLKARPPRGRFPADRLKNNNRAVSARQLTLAVATQSPDSRDLVAGPRFRSTGCSTADMERPPTRPAIQLANRNRFIPSPPPTPEIRASLGCSPLPPIARSETDSSSESDSSWGEAARSEEVAKITGHEAQQGQAETMLTPEEIWIR